MDGDGVTANPSALLMEVDDTVGKNVYRSNFYVSGKIEGRTPGGSGNGAGGFLGGLVREIPDGAKSRRE